MHAERDWPERLRRGSVVEMPRPRVAARRLLLAAALGFVVGLLVGSALAIGYFDRRMEEIERRLIPPGKVYEHGEPVRR